MKAKAPTQGKISPRLAENLKAEFNRARYGRATPPPEILLVTQCLSDIFQGSSWTELPDGIQRRKKWDWLHFFWPGTETRIPYKYWVELDWDDSVDGCASDGGELRRNTLINQFMAYVIMGDHNGVRRIAKAIEEVHKRIDVDSLVSLEPRHPSRLDFLRKFGGSGASMSASEVSSKICYKDGGAISETNARRIRANAGLKAVKSRSARKEH